MNEELFRIIMSLILFICSVYVLPAVKKILKSKFGASNYAYIEKQIKDAVLAAEQIFNENSQGKTKKEFVLNYLHKLKIPLSDKEIDILIEKAVYYLK